MIHDKVQLICSVKEPGTENLWLRPRVKIGSNGKLYPDEGYDLLYFGAKGWTPLIDCCGSASQTTTVNSSSDKTPTTKDSTTSSTSSTSTSKSSSNAYTTPKNCKDAKPIDTSKMKTIMWQSSPASCEVTDDCEYTEPLTAIVTTTTTTESSFVDACDDYGFCNGISEDTVKTEEKKTETTTTTTTESTKKTHKRRKRKCNCGA